MADRYTPYTTVQGDRWDTIAQKAYGESTEVMPIIRANPGVMIEDVLPDGIRLIIPVIDKTQSAVSSDQLPPWKR